MVKSGKGCADYVMDIGKENGNRQTEFKFWPCSLYSQMPLGKAWIYSSHPAIELGGKKPNKWKIEFQPLHYCSKEHIVSRELKENCLLLQWFWWKKKLNQNLQQWFHFTSLFDTDFISAICMNNFISSNFSFWVIYYIIRWANLSLPNFISCITVY